MDSSLVSVISNFGIPDWRLPYPGELLALAIVATAVIIITATVMWLR